MPRVTQTYRLPYILEGEAISGVVERIRFTTIDKQLEALYTFLGDGVISGWEVKETIGRSLSVTITAGSGVVSSIAAGSSGEIEVSDLLPGTATGNRVNYIYAQLLSHTPYTAQVNFIASPVLEDSGVFLTLAKVVVDQKKNIVSIDTSEASGRKTLTFLTFVLSILKDHVHTGEPGEPAKIDLRDHVKGVIDATNLSDIPASKITGGIIPSERISLSHTDLSDIGTLTHPEIDSLVEKLQNINKLLFGDIMTSNMMQLLLSLKHVWSTVDEFNPNFLSIIPGIGPDQELGSNTRIDINATTAEMDYTNHRIRGVSLNAQEANQVTINSLQDWQQGNFDPSFVIIKETASAYGYGYGYGLGLDFFDVIEANQFNFLTGTETAVAFPGSTVGYGVSAFPSGENFETTFNESFGFGYGWEYAQGFPTTLSSTFITLVPQSIDTILHNKQIVDGGTGNTYVSSLSSPDNAIILSAGGNIARADFLLNIGKKITSPFRDNTISPDGDTSLPDNLYSFTAVAVGTGDIAKFESHKSSAYLLWTNSIDLTINDFVHFTIARDPSDGSNFDSTWEFDHSFFLFLEFTVGAQRWYYKFNQDGNPNFRIFDAGGSDVADAPIKYFQSSELKGQNGDVSEAQISAQITSSNIAFEVGLDITTGAKLTSGDPVFSTLIQNLTGVIFYSDTSLGHDNPRESTTGGATFIRFPQGRRELLLDDNLVATRMLADIDKIFVGGSFGFGDKITKNRIQDIIISFPDLVDFNTISWIAEEPGDSIVYIDVKRLNIDASYPGTPVYTDNTIRASDIGTSPIFAVGTDFRISGSEFTDQFKNINGIVLRVTMLPTTDNRVAPSINSITINYTSKTLSNEITVNSTKDWVAARFISNAKVSDVGEVSIQLVNRDFGKVKNVVYGTDRAVVEANADFGTIVNRYTGTNLPKTVNQEINGFPVGLGGFVTDVKKLKNGNIVLLDRDEGRIIELDQNYELKNIVASERVFFDNEDTGGETARFLKAIYNRELGDNGVLYLVFSHQIKAWNPSNFTQDSINTNQIFIKSKGQTITQSYLDDFSTTGTDVAVCDRGIISLTLNATTSNLIEGAEFPFVELRLEQDASSGAPTSIKFSADPLVVSSGTLKINITKVGTKGVFKGHNLVYAPIRGTTGIDVDDDNNLYYLLKKKKPYTFDTIPGAHIDGYWYVRFDPTRRWFTWDSGVQNSDPNIENSGSFFFENISSEESLQDPNFFINNFFGERGAIQSLFNYLLITIPGDKKVWVFRRGTGSVATSFSSPTSLTLPADGTVPMAARFDPPTTLEENYSFIYVALSDLRRSFTDQSGKSKVVKIQDDVVVGEETVWSWGAGADDRSTSAVSINDVRPLSSTGEEGVIVST